MTDITEKWRYRSNRPLTKWYGNVGFYENRVLGQWVCLDRESGRLLWQHDFVRPNSVVGVSGSVIVATEWRFDGPSMSCFGCYGIDLETGAIIWVSHRRSGIVNTLLTLVDYLPFYVNGFRDEPVKVKGQKVVCRSGRILDMQTGKDIRLEKNQELEQCFPEKTAPEELFESGLKPDLSKIQISPNRYLSHKAGPVDMPDDIREKLLGGRVDEISDEELFEHVLSKMQDFSLFCLDDENKVIWSFSAEEAGLSINRDYRHYRFHDGKVYVIASAETKTGNPSTRNNSAQQGSGAYYRLLELDTGSGRITRQVDLHDSPLSSCDIQDIGDDGIFIRCDEKELICYAI